MRISNEDILGAIADDSLHLIIFPTEACNFRCIYCYETFQHGKMKPNVVRSIKNFIRLRANSLKFIGISWFGGEPLLALDVIKDISHEAMTLAHENNGVIYSADMTTNGFLLNLLTFRELVNLRILRFQISFDGPQKIHDNKRVLANGSGTFTAIWDNLKSFRKIKDNFTILVRVHLAKDNYMYVGEFIKLYAKTFGDDKRFKLFLRPLSRLGCPRDADLPVLDEKNSHSIVMGLARQAKQLGIEPITTNDFLPICYATRLNCYAIRANGTINKCTVKLDHPENRIGLINTDGSLSLDRDKLIKWSRGLESRDANELACPLHGL